jgi:hypothetical protein
MLIILPGSVNFDKHFEGKMEGYLEIFGRKLCGKKEKNSWEICCGCARFPLKLVDFPEEINEMFVVVVYF